MLYVSKLDLKRSRQENFVTTGIVDRFEGGIWYVDIGLKSLVPLEKWYVREHLPNIKIGDKVGVYVSRFSNSEGETKINQKRYLYAINLARIKRAFILGREIDGEISRSRMGGFVVSLFPHKVKEETYYFEGFLPSSKTFFMNPGKLIGSKLKFKIQNFNARQKSIIVILSESNINLLENLMNDLKIGSFVDGRVTNKKYFGYEIVVSNGMHCFLNNKNKTFNPAKSDEIELQVGQQIKDLLISKKDYSEGRVFLSAKHIFDPLSNYFSIGQNIRVKIHGINKMNKGYTASSDNFPFIKFLLPMVEVSWKHNNYSPILEENTEIEGKVIKLSLNKVLISLKQKNPDLREEISKKYPIGSIIKIFNEDSNILTIVNDQEYMASIVNLTGNRTKINNSSRNSRFKVVGYNFDQGLVKIINKDLFTFYQYFLLRSLQIKIDSKILTTTVKTVSGDKISTVIDNLEFDFYPESIDDKTSNISVGKNLKIKVKELKEGRVMVDVLPT